MKDLLIRGNMGLGDHILTNGLVRHFAKAEPNRIIHVPCKTHNAPSVKWMFSDVDTIEVKSVADDFAADRMAQEFEDAGIAEVLRLSSTWPDGSNPPKGFDEAFYLSAGVPFEQRWEGFHVERDRDIEIKFPNPHIFVHDDPERGMAINPLDVYKHRSPVSRFEPMFLTAVGKGHVENIFSFWNAIEVASAIHCIPSCFSAWIDSMNIEMKGTPLFLHASARPGWDRHTYRKDWTIL